MEKQKYATFFILHTYIRLCSASVCLFWVKFINSIHGGPFVIVSILIKVPRYNVRNIKLTHTPNFITTAIIRVTTWDCGYLILRFYQYFGNRHYIFERYDIVYLVLLLKVTVSQVQIYNEKACYFVLHLLDAYRYILQYNYSFVENHIFLFIQFSQIQVKVYFENKVLLKVYFESGNFKQSIQKHNFSLNLKCTCATEYFNSVGLFSELLIRV